MNSPPEALSPSPSTPSSSSPSPDDALPPQLLPPLPAPPTASPSQAKRRLPASSASVFAGRENKSRRREIADERGRRWDGGAPPSAGGRMREDLVDVHLVEYVRNMYGDPLDDTIFSLKKTA